MKILILILGFTILLATGIRATAQEVHLSDVKIVGAMKNVMWKGELNGTIDLDTISERQHLYGFGPVEYLTGEILIIDGISYKASLKNDSEIMVEETFKIKAPFFAYANVEKWKELDLPDSILSINQLEIFLDQLTLTAIRPFIFKLKGIVEKAVIHIVNVPAGTIVRSPSDVHSRQKNFYLTDEQTEIIGFFSTEHKAIFTHHNTFLHMHLITEDKQRMGHLDDANFKSGTIKLYLPED